MKHYSVIITHDELKRLFVGKIKAGDEIVETLFAPSYDKLIDALFRFLDKSKTKSEKTDENAVCSVNFAAQLSLF